MTQDTMFLMLVGLAVALGGWGIVQIALGLVLPEKSKLQERLREELRKEIVANERLSAVRRHVEATDLPAFLADIGFFRWMETALLHAYPGSNINKFLLSVVTLSVIFFSVFTFALNWFVTGAIAGAGTLVVPLLVLAVKASQRQKLLMEQLIEALDFLSRVLKAGHSLSTGFKMMGEELPEPIATEFRRCYDQHTLGQPLEQAMTEMAARVNITDFSFFVTSVVIQRQTGGDLSEILGNISGTVRNRIRLHQHLKALTAEGRATGYILTALPVGCLFAAYAMNPQYAGVLFNTPTGRLLLGGTAVLQIIGLLMIRHIITLRV